MSDTDTTIYTCAPVSYRSNDLVSPPPGHRTGFFVTKKEKLWKIGHNVKTDDGTTILLYEFVTPDSEYPGLREVVKATISEWEEYANVKFVGKDENDPSSKPGSASDSDIRIQFGPGPSSWGYIGPSNPNDKVTVYLGGLPGFSPEKRKGVILHEFGHVLGMLHEHQSPVRGGDIVLNEEAVFKYFGGDRIFLRRQIINVFNHSDSNFSEFDPNSIMMYPLPAKLILEGKPVAANTELSRLDKAYIQLAYPHNSSERLLSAMGTIGIPDSDALDIIKPLMESASEDQEDLTARLEKVRDAFFDYNKNNIEAKALLKAKEAEAARATKYRR